MSKATETPEKPAQRTVQILTSAAEQARSIGKTLVESPKLILSAAVLAFSKLDRPTQVAMLAETRESLP